MHLSVVVPVLNEAENLEILDDEIQNALGSMGPLDFEVIYVDDGSTDGSVEVLERLVAKRKHRKLVQLSRNFGQTPATYCGFQESIGEVVIALDADLQNDPADIPRLYQEVRTGVDCVSGWRANRKDKGITRKLPSWIANRMLAKATGVLIHDSGCTLKGYDGELLRSIPLYGEMHRLIPFYVYLAGGSISEIEVNHRPRIYGKSKYGISRTFRVLQDILVARVQADFASRPMHFFGNVGLISMLIGLLTLAVSVGLKVFNIRDFVATPLPVLGSMFVLGGLQIAAVGLLAEIFIRRISQPATNFGYRIRRVLESK